MAESAAIKLFKSVLNTDITEAYDLVEECINVNRANLGAIPGLSDKLEAAKNALFEARFLTDEGSGE